MASIVPTYVHSARIGRLNIQPRGIHAKIGQASMLTANTPAKGASPQSAQVVWQAVQRLSQALQQAQVLDHMNHQDRQAQRPEQDGNEASHES
ncbi:TPA: hypothetical protein ACOFCQ_003820 [Stenotrophomonas maltophilia]